MSARGRHQLAVGGIRDSGFVLEDSKVSMMVKLIEQAEGDPEKVFSFKKDYLNACNNLKVIKMIREFGDSDPEGFCMTDHIFLLNNKMKRKRMRLMITNRSIFIFRANKSWGIVRRYSLQDLMQIVVSAKNFTLTAFKFHQGFDMLMDSYRRIDIVLYLAQRMKKAGIPIFKIVYLRNFYLKREKKADKQDLALKEKQLQRLNTALAETGKEQMAILQETFRNALHSGYLRIKEKKTFLFGSNNTEYFMILTNLGILYFKSFGKIKPQGFIPILGS